LTRTTSAVERDDVGLYLSRVDSRLHNARHAQVRVYTCRAWRANSRRTTAYELHWNSEDVAGETFLGDVDWSDEGRLARRVEAELAAGEAVRVFVFNSD